MNRRITIHKLSEQMGLTSRTLRHWEAEGLIQSERDRSSGWRVYDEEAVACISIIALLRALDIPIKEIHAVLAGKSLAHVRTAISRHIHKLSLQQIESARTQQELERMLLYLMQHESSNLAELARILTTMEEFNVTNTVESTGVRIVTLPPMRWSFILQ
ncbi:MerR family transcriptional regulator [Paenibacillus tepidiphilus]|uniref:MerR family transcriptional regulator n=1 Tax=Paenibacillus tepidiphilus TaxID=2608683 RepID=UPI0013A59DCD|nr:MerR family transcriptional regulator [Paenibacillus tepidiphilus]